MVVQENWNFFIFDSGCVQENSAEIDAHDELYNPSDHVHVERCVEKSFAVFISATDYCYDEVNY